MTFDPLDFFKLAKILHQSPPSSELKEAILRTIIGRAYYSSFLKYRELLRDLIMSETYDKIARTGAIHSCVIQLLKVLDKTMGMFLSSLHRRRREADYELNKHLDERVVEETLAIADRLLNTISIQKIQQVFYIKERIVQTRLNQFYEEFIRRRGKS